MECKMLKRCLLVAVVTLSGINVFNAQKPEVLSDVAMANVEALADDETGETGTLYGNEAGTRFCCKPGSSRTCGAAPCPF